jgi:hypothetical protein
MKDSSYESDTNDDYHSNSDAEIEDRTSEDNSTDTDAKFIYNSNTETKIQLNFEPCKAWFDEQESTTCKLYGALTICDKQLRKAIGITCSINEHGVTSRALPNGSLVLTTNKKTIQALVKRRFCRIRML